MDKILQKVVSSVAENVMEMRKKEEKLSNFKKILPALLEKGLDNINLSMFDEETKVALLNAFGDEYVRKGRSQEAMKAFILAGNKQKLTSIGEDYEKVCLFSNAIECYRLADNTDKLLKVGNKCLEEGKTGDAIKAFLTIKDVERLARVGEDCLRKEKYDHAIEVFNAIGETIAVIMVPESAVEPLTADKIPSVRPLAKTA